MHYLACDVSRRWMHDGLRLCDLPDVDSAHRIFLTAIASRRPGAIKVALALDATNFAFDSQRHGATQPTTSILDVRLKEIRRGFAAIRSMPIGMFG